MHIYIALLLCIFSFNTPAQDERFYRGIFSGEHFNSKEVPFTYKIEVESSKYLIDLNHDGKEDSIQTVKRDGVDFFRINDDFGKMVFEAQLETKGVDSKIFRASLKTISKNIDVLLLHFYEGHTGAAIFEATARLYIVTIKDRDFRKTTITKGPFFWSEKEGVAGKYWARRYTVNTKDFNGDGVKEVAITFNNIDRIYYYSKFGDWRAF